MPRAPTAVLTLTLGFLSILGLGAASEGSSPGKLLLPNLVSEQPGKFGLFYVLPTNDPDGSHWRLGFRSSAANLGPGPLIVAGRRSKPTAVMKATQVVRRAGGGQTTRAVGSLMYVSQNSHQHFHYLGFERYFLYAAAPRKLVAQDHKSGFCLGDREKYFDSAALGKAQRRVARPVFGGGCQRNHPKALAVSEGISSGWADSYLPYKHGQDLDLTNLPAGRYVFVNTVNPKHRLLESDYRDNDSSLALDIRWPSGTSAAPTVEVLNACAKSSRCSASSTYKPWFATQLDYPPSWVQ
jgi:hypothetical protein